ncbi:MAG TPA: nicotinate-nucleotide--dimethylbenzimidazole phosphoribosyltransferase, partial [Alphaproteobacteria bacterium]|nr:nicotinate-nucleotide--dimethylbenzimidazole phosphoribosyltransferase [Alphaproteobacteria bacterium]
MALSGLPLDDIRALLRSMPGPDRAAFDSVATREAGLLKPPGALGRLEELSAWFAAW